MAKIGHMNMKSTKDNGGALARSGGDNRRSCDLPGAAEHSDNERGNVRQDKKTAAKQRARTNISRASKQLRGLNLHI